VSARAQIPALVVSGFLGSGKTSLVRWLLEEAQRTGLRMAVVSNEFGALGIDQALLGDGGEAFVELEGGCVCCQLSNELVDTLQMLRERVDPDRIVIETSGVALPGETQMNLWREPVNAWVADDVAVVVVNAEQVLHERDLEGTFEYQLTSADLLVLNKLDLVPPAALPRIEAVLRAIEPEAPIVHSVHGRVDPAVLFPPDPAGARRERRAAGGELPPHVHEHFHSEILSFAPGIGEDDLVARVQALAALRAKGFVETERGLRLLQGVGPRVQLHPPHTPPPPELVGKVVVIRRGAGEGESRG